MIATASELRQKISWIKPRITSPYRLRRPGRANSLSVDQIISIIKIVDDVSGSQCLITILYCIPQNNSRRRRWYCCRSTCHSSSHPHLGHGFAPRTILALSFLIPRFIISFATSRGRTFWEPRGKSVDRVSMRSRKLTRDSFDTVF